MAWAQNAATAGSPVPMAQAQGGAWVDPDRQWLPFHYHEDGSGATVRDSDSQQEDTQQNPAAETGGPYGDPDAQSDGASDDNVQPDNGQPSAQGDTGAQQGPAPDDTEGDTGDTGAGREEMPYQEQPADPQIQVTPLQPLPYNPAGTAPQAAVPAPSAPQQPGTVPATGAAVPPGAEPQPVAPEPPASQQPGYQGFAPSPELNPAGPPAGQAVAGKPTDNDGSAAMPSGELDTMLKDMFGTKTPNPQAIASRPFATLRIINKNTGKREEITLSVKDSQVEAVSYPPFSFTVFNCSTLNRFEGVRHVAALDIQEHFKNTGDKGGAEELISRFHGWMVSDAAELNPLEHPIFDVTLVSCTDENPQHKANKGNEERPVADESPSGSNTTAKAQPMKSSTDKAVTDKAATDKAATPPAGTAVSGAPQAAQPAEDRLKQVHDQLPASMQKKQAALHAAPKVPAPSPHYAPEEQIPASQRGRSEGY